MRIDDIKKKCVVKYKAIKTIFPDKEILCFLNTYTENNASVLGGIPVEKMLDKIQSVFETFKELTNDAVLLWRTPDYKFIGCRLVYFVTPLECFSLFH